MRLTDKAHAILETHIAPGDCVIDATVGNGHDTLFLTGQVTSTGVVYGFDIQACALDATAKYLTGRSGEKVADVRLFHICHSMMDACIDSVHQQQISCVMFNLGYLPGGDHAFTTGPATTIKAIQCALRLLRPGGVISIIVYRAHDDAELEARAVADEVTASESTALIWTRYKPEAKKSPPPLLYVGQKF